MKKTKGKGNDLKRLIDEIEVTKSGMHLLELKPLILKYLKGSDE